MNPSILQEITMQPSKADYMSGGERLAQPQNPTEAYLIATNRCQLRCRYCWTEKDEHDMDTATALAAVKFIIDNAEGAGVAPAINLFGGEPLLCWDEVVVPVVRYIREEYQKPCHIGITTNCVALDEDRLKYLSGHNVGLLVSMDGCKSTNDKNRPFRNGSGSYDMIASKLHTLFLYYPAVGVRMTLTPDTVGTFCDDMLSLMNLGFKRVDCFPNCFEVWDDDALNELRTQIHKISNDYVDNFEMRNLGYGWREFERVLRDVKRINQAYAVDEHRCSSCTKCGIGVGTRCAIDYRGDIYPCHQAGHGKELWIGNITTGLDDEKRMLLASTYDAHKVRGMNCESCRYDNICDGVCTMFNYMSNGDFNVVSDVVCVWKQALIDEAEYILARMSDAKNIMFRDYFLGL